MKKADSHSVAANDWFVDQQAPSDERFEHMQLWTQLCIRNRVEIRRGPEVKPLLSGTVDDRMKDGSVVWIVTDDMRRVLVHASEEVDIWRCIASA